MKMFLFVIMAIAMVGCGTSGGGNPGGGGTDPTPTPGVKFDCQNPVGGVVKHGASVTLFKQDKVPFGSSCQSEVRTCDNGNLSGSAAFAACEVLPEQEPATHEKPMKISDEGLKMGGVKLVGDLYTWSAGEYSDLFPPKPKWEEIPNCAGNPIAGGQCSKNSSMCKSADKVFQCHNKKTYKVWGWIYEKNGLDYSKMAEGVKVDMFWFAGCLAGMCDPFAGPVYTDKFGYFEFLTGSLMDTLRLDGMPKYYMFCQKGAPIAGGGQYMTTFEGKAIGPFKQLINTPDACKENFFMKLFSSDEVVENPNNINGDYKAK